MPHFHVNFDEVTITKIDNPQTIATLYRQTPTSIYNNFGTALLVLLDTLNARYNEAKDKEPFNELFRRYHEIMWCFKDNGTGRCNGYPEQDQQENAAQLCHVCDHCDINKRYLLEHPGIDQI